MALHSIMDSLPRYISNFLVQRTTAARGLHFVGLLGASVLTFKILWALKRRFLERISLDYALRAKLHKDTKPWVLVLYLGNHTADALALLIRVITRSVNVFFVPVGIGRLDEDLNRIVAFTHDYDCELRLACTEESGCVEDFFKRLEEKELPELQLRHMVLGFGQLKAHHEERNPYLPLGVAQRFDCRLRSAVCALIAFGRSVGKDSSRVHVRELPPVASPFDRVLFKTCEFLLEALRRNNPRLRVNHFR